MVERPHVRELKQLERSLPFLNAVHRGEENAGRSECLTTRMLPLDEFDGEACLL